VANHCGRPILLVSADDDQFAGDSGLYLPLLHAHTNWFSKRLLVVGWQAKAHNHYVGVVPIKSGVDASQMAVDEAVKLTRFCLPNAEGTVLVRGLADAGGAADFGPLPGAEAEARLQECFGETWQGGVGFLEVGGEHEKDLSRLLPVRVRGDSGYGGLVRRDSTAAAQG
jgi:hypothetical protein